VGPFSFRINIRNANDLMVEAARGTQSKHTEQAWASDPKLTAARCSAAGLTALPASVETVLRFVDEMGGYPSPASVRCNVSNISHMPRATGLASATQLDRWRSTATLARYNEKTNARLSAAAETAAKRKQSV